MRVVGGKYRGKSLIAPTGQATRPTTDRVRENLFNILSNRIAFEEARVIDLFAGTGALGIEALSRGAQFCLFVENAAPARAAIRKNIETLGLTGIAKVFRRNALHIGPAGTMHPFNLAFADPPYGHGLGEQAAKVLSEENWLRSNAMFILEEENDSMPDALDRFETIDVRSYGDTSIGLFEYQG